ncbi:MAG: hypothetical protein GY759_24440, partial [Chloroflexi bacterium]|nr:hypothetical protein [Chloroflexota bacterium]
MRPINHTLRLTIALSVVFVVMIVAGGIAAISAADVPSTIESIPGYEKGGPDYGPQSLPEGDATRFRGYIRMGSLDDPGKGIAGVTVHCYGRNEGESRPGHLIQTRVSDGSGFFNLYILPDPRWIYDYYLLVVDTPSGLVPTGAWSESGVVLDGTHIEWHDPGGPHDFIHLNNIYFDEPPTSAELTILHTNDFHGNLETDYKGRGGSAFMATVISEVRDEVGANNVILADAGDVYLGA